METEIDAANAKLAAAIGEASRVMWEVFGMDGDHDEMLLSEWTVCAAFIDGDGEMVYASFSPASLPEHHRKGLLREGLDW